MHPKIFRIDVTPREMNTLTLFEPVIVADLTPSQAESRRQEGSEMRVPRFSFSRVRCWFAPLVGTGCCVGAPNGRVRLAHPVDGWTKLARPVKMRGAISKRSLFAAATAFTTVLIAADPQAMPSPAAATSPLGSGRLHARVYKSLIPPQVMDYMFGHALSKEYLAIQVTVVNESADFDMLIRDISVNELQRSDCVDRNLSQKPSAGAGMSKDQETKIRKIAQDEYRAQMKDIPKVDGQSVENILANTVEESPGLANLKGTCQSSSHELTNLRGAAERGMSQDPRNKYIRSLQAIGIVGGGLVGAAGLGPVLPRAVAAFTGSFIPANERLFPDYTIAQLNRLNDSAYAANTLVAKNRAKVVTVFIPLSSLLTRDNFKPFRTDPFKYFQGDSAHLGLNRLGIFVDYTHVVALDEVKPIITGVVVSTDQAKNLLQGTEAKGYVLGQFLDGADVDASNGDDLGIKVEIDKSRASTDNRLYILLKPSKALAPNSRIDLDVIRAKNRATFPFLPDLPIAPVSLLKVTPEEGQTFASGSDVKAVFEGDNFFNLGLKINALQPALDAGTISISSIKIESPQRITATLGLRDAKPGKWKVAITVNGLVSGQASLNIE